jgi:hypothetical protein
MANLEIKGRVGNGHCTLERPSTLPPQPGRTMAFLKRWLSVLVYALFIYLAEVALCAFEFSYAGPASQRVLGGPVAVAVVAVSLLVSLGILGFALAMARKGQPKTNVLACVVAAVLFTLIVSSIPDMLERIHLMLYFPLGVLAYRAHARRPFSIRLTLDLLSLFLVVVFVDNLVQGVLPNRSYSLEGGKNLPFLGLSLLGFLCARAYDAKRPMSVSWRRRPARAYAGRKPLLDLHLYERDLAYAALAVALLAANHWIYSAVSNEDLVGRWRPGSEEASSVLLRKDSSVRCATGDAAKRVGRFEVSGTLFDGFFLTIYPDPRWDKKECGFLLPHLNSPRRFRIGQDRLEFYDTAETPKGVFQTLFGTQATTNPAVASGETAEEVWQRLD